MRTTEIPNFARLTDMERIALAEKILGSIRQPESLPSPIVHRRELERRWAAYKANPAIARSKNQFRAEVAALKK